MKRGRSGKHGARRLRYAAISVCVFACSVSSARAYDPLNGDFTRANPLDVRIVSYNHHGDFIDNSSADAAFNRILTALDADVYVFQEFVNGVSQGEVANRMNAILPVGGAGWQVHFGLLAGVRTAIVSRHTLTMTRVDTIPTSATRGVTIALVDLPDADYSVDVYLLGVHLKCCGDPGGSEDDSRQDSADAIANWLGDARGVARPSGNNVVLPSNTPMIALGDFNLVGGPQPEDTLLTGDIQDTGTYGPDVQGDWDVSDMTNLMPSDPFTGNTFTWQGSGSFRPSALDRFFYSDSAITVANSFILNTDTMTPAALSAAGLQANDTLPSETSDHLPIAMDLGMAFVDCNNNGQDDAIDISSGASDDCDGNGVPDDCQPDSDGDELIDVCDGCPNDSNKTLPGICGCGVADTDGDNDGTPDCNDGCPVDPDKTAPGICGCGVSDVDGDNDGTPDCNDGCPSDPDKIAPGVCGCGVSDADGDNDGTPDCNDGCPSDPDKIAPGVCGCGQPDTPADGDMNGDSFIDGSDLRRFVEALVGTPTTADNCHGDFDADTQLGLGDIPGMVNGLLTAP